MAMSRQSRLILLGLAAVGLVGLLSLSLRNPRTIVVSTQAPPELAEQFDDPDPSRLEDQVQGDVVGDLANPRFTGRTGTGSTWELTAARASQFATQTSADPMSGAVSLTTVAARWEPTAAPPLQLEAPSARYTPSDTALILPQGLSASGEAAGYRVALTAPTGHANLTSQTLRLTGGVSATLTPR